MRNLVEMLERAAGRAPAGLAFIDEAGSLTFADCWYRSLRLAAEIASRTERSRVGLLLHGGRGFVVSFFGTLAAGRVPVPLNLLLSTRELAACVRDAEVDLLLTTAAMVGSAGGLAEKVLVVEDVFDEGVCVSSTRSTPDEVAVLLYTSGTTAVPKGVLLTHGNLLADAGACCRAVGLTPDNRLLGLLPLFHAFGLLTSVVAPVLLGATSILAGRFQPRWVADLIARHRPTVLLAVPSMYGALCRSGVLEGMDLSSLKICIVGGEPLPRVVAETFRQQTGRPLLEGYGLTEAGPVVTLNPPEAPRPGTAGPPLPGVEVRITDRDGNPLPFGSEGEIWIRGPNVMFGYHRRPEETAAVLTPDGWLRSGDLGLVDRDGYLTITGRLKDLIICGGENILPGEVEEVLLRHPAVGEAAVVGAPDPVRGEVPRAFVALHRGCSVSAAELLEFCRRHLAGFKVPRSVEFLPQLPRTPTGKLDRRALRQPHRNPPQAEHHPATPG